jgi:hypothetical protein
MISKEETPRSLLEACAEIETAIRAVQYLLLDPRPEALDRCEAELTKVIQIMEGLISGPSQERNPAAAASLHQIGGGVKRLGLQIAHASNLHLGWAQLRLVTGYTSQGLPVFKTGEERSSFEG